MIVLFDNNMNNAVISASSENPYYLFDSALKDIKLSRCGKTSSHLSQWISFAYPSNVTATHVIINGHNISETATVTLEANDTDVWTSPAFSQVLTVANVIYATFTQIAHKYFRITINDTSNAEGFIKVSSVFIGTALTMPPYGIETTLSLQSNSVRQLSTTRQVFSQEKIRFKNTEIPFAPFDSNFKTLAEAFISTVDTILPYYIVMWENDVDEEPPLYVINDEFPEIKKIIAKSRLYTMTMKVSEVF